jgi:phage tail protein X
VADYAAPVALGIKAPSMSEAMTPISTMLNARNTAQQFQQGQVQLQQSQMDLEERNNLRTLAQDIKKYQTKDGGLDLPALVGDATRVAPKSGMAWAQQVASSHAEGIAVNTALNTLGEQRRAAIGKVVMSVAEQPYDVQAKVIDSVVDGNPGLSFWGDMAKRHLQGVAGKPEAKTVAQRIAQATMGVHEQAEATTPGGPVISSGQVTQQINTKPLAGPVGPVAGTAVQAEVPPTAGTVDEFREPADMSGREKQAVLSLQARDSAFPKLIAGSVDAVNKDWVRNASKAASNAQQDIGVLQNIKKYAKGAITGVGSSKRQVTAGRFSGWVSAVSIGMEPRPVGRKPSTDLLAKNSNMLALAGGNTDLARTHGRSRESEHAHDATEAIQGSRRSGHRSEEDGACQAEVPAAVQGTQRPGCL